jgi:hypothetical protein
MKINISAVGRKLKYLIYLLTDVGTYRAFVSTFSSFKSAIEIRCFGLEFCTAGIYHFVHPLNSQVISFGKNVFITGVAL